MTSTNEAPATQTTAAPQPKDHEYSFEEFRMMYESTEKVSDRKINFMRNNSQLCIAIIAGQGIAASWAIDNQNMAWVVAITELIIGILGVFFCRYWLAQLDTFKSLNDAKFKVLEEMAAFVRFPDYKERTIRSKNPFFREYEIMKIAEKVVKEESGRPVPKSSEAEKTVPACFLAFYSVSIALSAVWLVIDVQRLWQQL